MPRRKRAEAAEASAANPTPASTASQRKVDNKRAPTRSRVASTPTMVVSAGAHAEQEAPLTSSQPATALTPPQPELASPEALSTLPGALLSGTMTANTVGVTAVASTVTLDAGLS